MAIDINCDLGEYNGENRDMGWTEQLMKYISSCNIACGFHAGDPTTLAETIQLAIKYKVVVGAHPSYPDIKNFGRTSMDLPTEELQATMVYQISALKGMAEFYETSLTHVKAHGALYHDLNERKDYAEAYFEVIKSIDPNLVVYGPPGDIFEHQAAKSGISFIPEGFADRVYINAHKLQSRSVKGAVIIDPEKAFEQVKTMVYERKVPCKNGKTRPLEVKTICVHGDNPAAIMILQRIRKLLYGN